MEKELPLEQFLGIDHIGIAVNNIEESEKMYEILGYVKQHDGVLVDNQREVRVSFLKNQEVIIELIAPLSCERKSVIDKYLKLNIGYAMYHVCYKVKNLEKAIEILKKQKYIPMQEISIAQLMDDRREIYMFHKKMGLVELLESR